MFRASTCLASTHLNCNKVGSGQCSGSFAMLYKQPNAYREREGMRADMRAREAEAEAQVRGLAAQRSQLDSKQQPVDHYVSSGGAQRLQEVTQRLVGSREKLQEKESLHKVSAESGRVPCQSSSVASRVQQAIFFRCFRCRQHDLLPFAWHACNSISAWQHCIFACIAVRSHHSLR